MSSQDDTVIGDSWAVGKLQELIDKLESGSIEVTGFGAAMPIVRLAPNLGDKAWSHAHTGETIYTIKVVDTNPPLFQSFTPH